MYEHKLLNILFYLLSQLMLLSLFFPWIGIDSDRTLNVRDTSCKVYAGDSFGFLDTVCGVSLVLLEPELNIVLWTLTGLTCLVFISFTIFNWHLDSMTYDQVERKVIFVIISILVFSLIGIVSFWVKIEMKTFPSNRADINVFGVSKVLVIFTLILSSMYLCFVTFKIITNYKT
jgi:hypothetical protein